MISPWLGDQGAIREQPAFSPWLCLAGIGLSIFANARRFACAGLGPGQRFVFVDVSVGKLAVRRGCGNRRCHDHSGSQHERFKNVHKTFRKVVVLLRNVGAGLAKTPASDLVTRQVAVTIAVDQTEIALPVRVGHRFVI